MSEVLNTHLSVAEEEPSAPTFELDTQADDRKSPLPVPSEPHPLATSSLGKRARSNSSKSRSSRSVSLEEERETDQPKSRKTSANEEHPHKKAKLSLEHQSDGSKLDEVPTGDISPNLSENLPSQPPYDQPQCPQPTEPAGPCQHDSFVYELRHGNPGHCSICGYEGEKDRKHYFIFACAGKECKFELCKWCNRENGGKKGALVRKWMDEQI